MGHLVSSDCAEQSNMKNIIPNTNVSLDVGESLLELVGALGLSKICFLAK